MCMYTRMHACTHACIHTHTHTHTQKHTYVCSAHRSQQMMPVPPELEWQGLWANRHWFWVFWKNSQQALLAAKPSLQSQELHCLLTGNVYKQMQELAITTMCYCSLTTLHINWVDLSARPYGKTCCWAGLGLRLLSLIPYSPSGERPFHHLLVNALSCEWSSYFISTV